MTDATQSSLTSKSDQRPRLGRDDPLLQELWQVKAILNSEADFSVARLAEQAEGIDLDTTIARLLQQTQH